MIGPREDSIETGYIGCTRGNQTDEVLFFVGGIERGVEEDGREGIDHGGDILIGGITLYWVEVLLCIFERGGGVLWHCGQNRGIRRDADD